MLGSTNIFSILEGDNALDKDKNQEDRLKDSGNKPEVRFIRNDKSNKENNRKDSGKENDRKNNKDNGNRQKNQNSGNTANGQDSRNNSNTNNQARKNNPSNDKPKQTEDKSIKPSQASNDANKNSQNSPKPEQKNNEQKENTTSASSSHEDEHRQEEEASFSDNPLFQDMDRLADSTLAAGMAQTAGNEAGSDYNNDNPYPSDMDQTGSSSVEAQTVNAGYPSNPNEPVQSYQQPPVNGNNIQYQQTTAPSNAQNPTYTNTEARQEQNTVNLNTMQPQMNQPYIGSPTIPPFHPEEQYLPQGNQNIMNAVQTAPVQNTELRDLSSVGVRTDVHTAAKLLRCTEQELIDATSLLNEYLTVTKVNDSYMYNRFDIERLEQFFDDMEGKVGLSDEMMLNYAEVNFSKPFDTKMEEITSMPAQIEDSIRSMMNRYTLDVKNSLAPIITNMGSYMKMTGQTLRHQEALIESNKRLLEEQQRVITGLLTRLDENAQTMNDMKAIAETLSQQSEDSDAALQNTQGQLKDLLSQVRSNQGATIKAINTVSDTVKSMTEEGINTEDRTDEVLSALENLLKKQDENTEAISSINEAIDSLEPPAPEDDEELDELINENDELKAKIQEYEERLSENEDALKEKEELEEKLSSYEQELDDTDALQEKIADYEAKIAEQEDAMAQASDYRAKLETAIKNIAAESDQKTELINTLQSQLAEADREDSGDYFEPEPQGPAYSMDPQYSQRVPMSGGYYQSRSSFPSDAQEYTDYGYQPSYEQPSQGPTVTVNRPAQGAVAGALKEAADDTAQPKKKKFSLFSRH